MLRSIFCFFILAGATAFAQQTPRNLWQDIDEKPMLATAAARSGNVDARRNIVPQKYRALELNRAVLENILSAAPQEFSGPMEIASVQLSIPLPDGSYGRFNVQESPVMEPELAAKYPEIKTYVGQGIDDPAATMRIDLTTQGFHAMILSPNGQIFVDPYWRDSDATYVAYAKKDFVADKPFSCVVEGSERKKRSETGSLTTSSPTGATLRKYRLALACTGGYAVAVCSPNSPSVPTTLAAMVTSVNRVSAVYERDLAIRLVLVGNTDLLIYLDAATDPYSDISGGNPAAMLSQNQTNIDNVIGDANYDIGHVFSRFGGGVANLDVVCQSGGKARGVTGSRNPTGDPYDIDYVAHEMGHQFAGNHPFNSVISSCGGNRSSSTAYEVGSGTTIMAYAGICDDGSVNTNLAPHSDVYFHAVNYIEIDNFTTTGWGSSCPITVATGNHPPVIAPAPSFTIPANTPFALTGSATDADGDTLTYIWDEYDLANDAQTTQNPLSDSDGPIFRSLPPTTNPTRYFPSLTYILNNANVPPAANAQGYATGEILPSISRAMNFHLTVRDNHAGGGGSDWIATTVTTVNIGAAFAVTAPNVSTTFAGGSQQTITWNVAGSDANGINCANVKISLSTDGGYTFPTVLAASAPNNGSALVTIPQIATTQGRIKVEAVGNIFFDISDANFTITSANHAPTISLPNSISVPRGKPVATVAIVGTASDTDGDALSVSVSNVPFGANVSPSISGGNISLSALVDCAVVTTLVSRTYPITLAVTDSNGASVSGTASLVVTPNASPTLGVYPNIDVVRTTSVNSTPTAPAADANGNLLAAPYSIAPVTLPGGGTISINQSTGVVTVSATTASTLGPTTIRVTALDSCGAAAVSLFSANVLSASPSFTNGIPPSPVTVGAPYTFTFTATGAPVPTFSLTSGSLPPGLSLSSGGVLSGTPTSTGSGSFSNITVTASNGVLPNAPQTFSLNVVTSAANYLASFNLSGSNAALLLDYDLDGISNLMEYALRLDPTVASRIGLPIVTLKDYSGTKYLSMTFTRSSVATDLTYTVQGSSDLISWSDLATSTAGAAISGVGFVGETGSAPALTDEVRDTVPNNSVSPARFLRLKVTSP